MSVFSLLEFAAGLEALGLGLEATEAEVLAKSCQLLSTAAKDLIGVPKPEWPPLKPETLARKDGVNTPLLETGEMRDSIAWNSDAHEGYVGSNSEILRYQEFGTSRGIPPRPVLGLAAAQNEREVERIAEKAVSAAFGGALGGVGEILHALREAGHHLHKAGEGANELMHGGDEDSR